jgi:hypothetical protein
MKTEKTPERLSQIRTATKQKNDVSKGKREKEQNRSQRKVVTNEMEPFLCHRINQVVKLRG